ncbi:MAG: DUF3426 domain-containing protein [Gammaproteobacteria bacterium]|nr:DUF3426 domain-containing protein [Gammaproteobacteria bacterium]
MKKSEFRIHASDVNAAIVARNRRTLVRRPGFVSWLTLAVFAVLAAGSAFVALELPVQIPDTPSTPLLRQVCARVDCGFPSESPSIVLEDMRLSDVVMRAAAQPGALAFNAVIVNTAGRAQPWPALVFQLFDGAGRFLEKRRLEGADYASRDALPANAPLAVAITLDKVPPEAVQYSVTPTPSARRR